MPKATLTFSLPDEQEEYKTAMRGIDYYCALEDVRNVLREKVKYAELPADQAKFAEELYEKFWDILKDHEIVDDF